MAKEKLKDHLYYETVKAKLMAARTALPCGVYDMLDWIGNQEGGYRWARHYSPAKLARIRMAQRSDKRVLGEAERQELLDSLIYKQAREQKRQRDVNRTRRPLKAAYQTKGDK